jgi:hypothetical protein
MARIALGESACAFFAVSRQQLPPIKTTHQRPPLSQCGAYAKQRFKDHPIFAARPQLTMRYRATGRKD